MPFYIPTLHQRIEKKNRTGNEFHRMDAATQTHDQQTQQQIKQDTDNLGKLNDVKLLIRSHQHPMGHTPIIGE